MMTIFKARNGSGVVGTRVEVVEDDVAFKRVFQLQSTDSGHTYWAEPADTHEEEALAEFRDEVKKIAPAMSPGEFDKFVDWLWEKLKATYACGFRDGVGE
jgi:hypothetical protein